MIGHLLKIYKEGNLGLDMYLFKKTEKEVAYWRKANAIHNWFVKNIQDGNDDCKDYTVSTYQLETLLDVIRTVLKSIKLVDGDITNGMTLDKDGKWNPILEKGKIIKNPSIARKLLPTTKGFFFGGTDYDQCYYGDLIYTEKKLKEIIKKDGDYYYSSSW